MHKHQCPQCGVIWEHNDACAFFDSEIFDASHRCGICGIVVTRKYYGDAVAQIRQQCTQERLHETIIGR